MIPLIKLLMVCFIVLLAPLAAADDGEPFETSLPGAEPFPLELLARFKKAGESLAPSYVPRTRHLSARGKAKYSNRLFLEASPYLLQHAHNPVNWYPWGEEAFAAARRLNRPVFLSVGYSTCHWCHVMEEESFEDEEIARYLNEHFIAVKVDREERPDVDAVYMAAVQALTGGGGWPMSVWLTPDKKPFFGGTYFPPRDGARGAQIGFLTMLKSLNMAYKREPAKIEQAAAQLQTFVKRSMTPTADASLPGAASIREVIKVTDNFFDEVHGGLKQAPKFPSSLPVRLLLRYARRTGEKAPREQAVLTLRKMAEGGMYDQIGGGFHRYSTDREWLVPHFEKMLYDNALLVSAYLDGWQVTGQVEMERVVRETLRYVEREMIAPTGGFYAATDADSLVPGGGREEGYFFTWTPGEVDAVLPKPSAELIKIHYGVTVAGHLEGRNILHVAVPFEEAARKVGLPPDRARKELEAAREKLYQARRKRPGPLRDEKILTSWNGLMIGAFAQAGLLLAEPRYNAVASRAAEFILKHMRRGDRLVRFYKDGAAYGEAFLDDYAFLVSGLLNLYEATGKVEWIRAAVELSKVLDRDFWDADGGGYFATRIGHEELLAREKPARDGAVPSGNSVAIMNLLRLAEFTLDEAYRKRAEAALHAVGGSVRAQPMAHAELLLAVDWLIDQPKEIIVVAPSPHAPELAPLMNAFRKVYAPSRILAVVDDPGKLPIQSHTIPLLEGKRPLRDKATAYVCTQQVCKLPTSDPDVFSEQITKVTGYPE